MTNACGTCCLLFLAIFCPPIAVAIHMGCGADMCINWCLTFLLYFPGLIHAWIVILTKKRPNECQPAVVHVHQAPPAAAGPAAPAVYVVQPPAPVSHQYHAAPVPYPIQPPYMQQAPYAEPTKDCPPPHYQ